MTRRCRSEHYAWSGWMVLLLAGCGPTADGPRDNSLEKVTLLNVSYDPTRELYTEVNASFAELWKRERGQEVEIDQSHGGSGKQARAVTEGLAADVVSLALSGDIDMIAKKSQLLVEDWQTKFPNNSSPYTSTIVFLVRKGNPKHIQDWPDLVKDGVEVITANPKTGGGARWNYLAAWGFALHRELGDLKRVRDPSQADAVEAANAKAKEFLRQIYQRVPVLDASARAATNTFIQRQIGDVLLAWENEAFLAIRELGTGDVEIVVPSRSILAEPPVAVVTRNTEKHGTTEVAKAYIDFLYTDAGQHIIAKHYYRPRNTASVAPEQLSQFSKLELFELTDLVSGWEEAQEVHFKDRTGLFDQIYQAE